MPNPWLAALAGGLSGFGDWQQKNEARQRQEQQDALARKTEEDRHAIALLTRAQMQAQTDSLNESRKAQADLLENTKALGAWNALAPGADLTGTEDYWRKNNLGPGMGATTAPPRAAAPMALPGMQFGSLPGPDGQGAAPFEGDAPTIPGFTLGDRKTVKLPGEADLTREATAKLKQGEIDRETQRVAALGRVMAAVQAGKPFDPTDAALASSGTGGSSILGNILKPPTETQGSDFNRYLQTVVTGQKQTLGRDLTPQELQTITLKARKDFGQSDDQPSRPPVPVIIQGPEGYYQVTRGGTPTATPVQAPGGGQLGPAPTASMKEYQENMKGLMPLMKNMENLSASIITKIGPAQRADAAKRGAAAVFGADPDFNLYSNFRNGLSVMIAVAQQGSRPSDADVLRAALPMIPDPYTSTKPEAEKAWKMIYSLFSGRLSPEMRAQMGIPDPVVFSAPPGAGAAGGPTSAQDAFNSMIGGKR